MKLRGEWLDCPALNAEVEIRTSGIKKTLSLSGDPRKLKLVAALEPLIRNASKLSSSTSYAPDQERSIVAYHYLQSMAALGGEELTVRFVVKEDDKGNYHWDHAVQSSDIAFDSAKKSEADETASLRTTTSNGRAAVETGATRLVSGQPTHSVGDAGLDGNLGAGTLDSASGSRLVLNLFIEGEPVVEMEEEAEEAENEPPAEPTGKDTPAGVNEDGELEPEGAENVVKTAKGSEVQTGFTVVEAKELIASHDINGDPNPAFPAELQPRDRGRDASIAWVFQSTRPRGARPLHRN